MTEDKKFIDGFFVKEPTRDFIKCSISIKKADFTDWYRKELKTSDDDWINIDVKEGKSENGMQKSIPGNQKSHQNLKMMVN